MKAKKNISIEEQLKRAAAGATTEGSTTFKNMISTDEQPINEPTFTQSPKPTFAKTVFITNNQEDIQEPPQEHVQETPQQVAPPVHKETLQQPIAQQFYTEPPQQFYTPPKNEPTYEPAITSELNSQDRFNSMQQNQKTFYNEPTQETYTYEQSKYNNSHYDTPLNNGNLNIQNVSMIIEMADIYRGLDRQVQEIIKRFIKVNKELTSNNPKDLSNILLGIINVSSKERMGLNDLISLKTEERTSRAFSMVALNSERLKAVQDLVLLFNSSYCPKQNMDINSNKILFCRELEIGIDSLSHSTLELLKPINTLFLAIK